MGGESVGCRSCGVARSIIAGFHPVDPGSNPGTSTLSKKRYCGPVFESIMKDTSQKQVCNLLIQLSR